MESDLVICFFFSIIRNWPLLLPKHSQTQEGWEDEVGGLVEDELQLHLQMNEGGSAPCGKRRTSKQMEEKRGLFIVKQTLIFQGNISFFWQEARLTLQWVTGLIHLFLPLEKTKGKKWKLEILLAAQENLQASFCLIISDFSVDAGSWGHCYWGHFVRLSNFLPKIKWIE